MITKKDRVTDLIGILFFVFGAGVLIRSACLTVSSDIWFDELFTVELASKPVKELVSLAARDVHPPFYYLIVRVVYIILNGITGADVIFAAKITSVIPYFLLLIYTLTFIRKRFGTLGAGLGFFWALAAPKMIEYTVEARMYSWCGVVVAAMFMHAWAVVDAALGSRKKTKYYVNLLTVLIYGICAMYLHYYSAIAAICIVIWMVVKLFVDLHNINQQTVRSEGISSLSPDKSEDDNYNGNGIINSKHIVVSCVACIILGIAAYIPWLKSALSQAGAVKNSYWIQPLTWRIIPGCIKYIFTPEFESQAANVLLCGVCVVCVAAMFVYMLILSRKDKSDSLHNATFIAGTFIIPACTILTGIIISFLIKPVFVYRYMIPVLILFWMGCGCMVSHLVSYVNHNFILVAASALIICMTVTCVRDISGFIGMEKFKAVKMAQAEDFFSDIENNYGDEIIVCNFNQIQALMWHYLPNDSILWGETEELLIADICARSPIVMTTDYEELKDMVSERGQDSFLFFGSFNSRDDIIDEWEARGASCEPVYDSVFVERYYFNVYNVMCNE